MIAKEHGVKINGWSMTNREVGKKLRGEQEIKGV